MRECKRFKVYSACDHVLTTCENTIKQNRSEQSWERVSKVLFIITDEDQYS